MIYTMPHPGAAQPLGWRLPCFSSEAAGISRALYENGPDGDGVVNALLDSPSLSIELLVPALWEGNMRDWARSILRRAGQALVTSWLLHRAMSAAISDKHPHVAMLRHSRMAARLSRMIAIQTNLCSPDEAWLAGLWHNLGQFEYAVLHPGYPGPVCDGREAALVAGERKQYGLDHAKLAARQIARRFSVKAVYEAIEVHHAPVEFVVGLHPLACVLRAVVELLGETEGALEHASHLTGISTGDLTQMRDAALGEMLQDECEVGPADSLLVALAIRGCLESAFSGTDESGCMQRLVWAAQWLSDRPAPVVLEADEQRRLLPVAGSSVVSAPLQLSGAHGIMAGALLTGRVVHAEITDACAAEDWLIGRSLESEWIECVPWASDGCRGLAVFAAQEKAANDEVMISAVVNHAARSLHRLKERRDQQQQVIEEALNSERIATRQISHEISNPLAVIGNYLDVMSRDESVRAGALLTQVSLVQSEIQRAQRLLALIGRASATPSPRPPVGVNELLLDLCALGRESLFSERGIELTMQLAADLPSVSVPGDALKQILLNLLLNASEALESGGIVRLSTDCDTNFDNESWVRVVVEDNGPGLPRQQSDRLTLPTTTEKGGVHRGVGLAVVRDLLAAHGGHLLCRSHLGEGTSLSALLPVAPVT